jgi:hypothetical protein
MMFFLVCFVFGTASQAGGCYERLRKSKIRAMGQWFFKAL